MAPTAETEPILAVARALLASAQPMIEDRGLTLLGMAVANLDDDDTVQLALPFDRYAGGALDTTLDEIKERFGTRPSPAPCCSGAAPGCRCPCFRTDHLG